MFFYSEQGSLLMGIDKKIVKRQGTSRLHPLFMHSIVPIKRTVLLSVLVQKIHCLASLNVLFLVLCRHYVLFL